MSISPIPVDQTPFAQMPADYVPKQSLTGKQTVAIVAIALAAIAAGIILLAAKSKSNWCPVGIGLTVIGGLALLTTPLIYSGEQDKLETLPKKWEDAKEVYALFDKQPEKKDELILRQINQLSAVHGVMYRRRVSRENKVLIEEFKKGLSEEGKLTLETAMNLSH